MGRVVTPKKGVGHWYAERTEVIDALGSSWYYNWSPKPVSGSGAVKAEFVPMVWNGDWEMDEYLEHVRTAGYEALLGFNEPDGEGTNHLSVDDALALWPRLEATGLRLGGPACAEVTPWLDEFMAKAKAQGRRVDFVCAHWYGDITKPDPVGDLRFFLEAFWKEFRLPIWLTEFSGANIWDRTPTVEDNARFVAEAIPMLESLPFLERYAWFAPLSPATDRNYPTVALCRPDGSFTPVGTAYREAG